jgi:hypothetical protein
MINATYDNDRPNIPLLTALSGRYSLEELAIAFRDQAQLRVWYYPSGKSGRARVWSGVLDGKTWLTLRQLIGVARGRLGFMEQGDMRQYVDPMAEDKQEIRYVPAFSPGRLGDVRDGYDKIRTYKWTTDGTTGRKMPPNTLVWRDLHSGKVYLYHPADEMVG